MAAGAKFVEVPSGFDDRARQVAADRAFLATFNFEDAAVAERVSFTSTRPAPATCSRQRCTVRGSSAPFRPATSTSTDSTPRARFCRLLHRIGGHHLAFVDDDHLLAGLLDFRQDVGAQNDGVIAGKALDQIARLVDLLGVETRGRLVENQYVGIVNDGLRQADALAITLGKLAEQLVLYVVDVATVA